MTRNEAYLAIVEGWIRDNRGMVFVTGAADNLCDRIAAEIELRQGQVATLRELRTLDTTEIERLISERNDYEAEGRRHIKTIAVLRAENAELTVANKYAYAALKELRAELEELLRKYGYAQSQRGHDQEGSPTQ